MDRQEIMTDTFLYNMFKDFKVCKYIQAKNLINLIILNFTSYLILHFCLATLFLYMGITLCGTK